MKLTNGYTRCRADFKFNPMKGHLPAGRYDVRIVFLYHKEIAMKMYDKVTQIGLDVHRKFSIASLRDTAGRVLARERLNHTDRESFTRKISAWPARTPVVLEGSFGWGWMSDELLASNLDPHLASGRKVAAWRVARGLAKSNNLDADLLGELWSEKPTCKDGRVHRWWEVWLAPRAVRDQRELLRHRASLVRMQTEVKNRIHAILHRHGLVTELSDLFGVSGRRWLSQLAGQEDTSLRDSGKQTLKDLLILLDTLRRLIARLTRQFRTAMRRSDIGQRLMTLPGVSTILAYTITAEIGQLERFADSRALLRYSLLAPQADDSGEQRDGKPVGRRIGHMGRTTLQWAWIEAAHGAARKDATCAAIFHRRTEGGKKDKGRGYITVANRLCRVAYAMWKNQTEYQQVPPPRPGTEKPSSAIASKEPSKEKKRLKPGCDSQRVCDSPRPGTGQPLAAMAGNSTTVPEATV
jgi:transposase